MTLLLVGTFSIESASAQHYLDDDAEQLYRTISFEQDGFWAFGSDHDSIEGFGRVHYAENISDGNQNCYYAGALQGNYLLASSKGASMCYRDGHLDKMPANATSAAQFNLNSFLYHRDIDANQYDEFRIQFDFKVYGPPHPAVWETTGCGGRQGDGDFRVVHDSASRFGGPGRLQIDIWNIEEEKYESFDSIGGYCGRELMFRDDQPTSDYYSGRGASDTAARLDGSSYYTMAYIHIDADGIQDQIDNEEEGSGVRFLYTTDHDGRSAYIDSFTLYGIKSDTESEDDDGGWGGFGF